MRSGSKLRGPSRVFGGLALLLLLAGHVQGAEAKAGDAAKKPAPDAGACQLIIEGQHIERLTFTSQTGKLEHIQRPGSTVLLPAGRYLLQEVALTGGFKCHVGQWLTLSADKPCHLKVGASLTPSVKASRQGRILELSYKLVRRQRSRVRGLRPLEPAPVHGLQRRSSCRLRRL